MNIVNVMTCTMHITGESNCIMQLSVGAHSRCEYGYEIGGVHSAFEYSACQAKTKSNERNFIIFRLICRKHANTVRISFTSIHFTKFSKYEPNGSRNNIFDVLHRNVLNLNLKFNTFSFCCATSVLHIHIHISSTRYRTESKWMKKRILYIFRNAKCTRCGGDNPSFVIHHK